MEPDEIVRSVLFIPDDCIVVIIANKHIDQIGPIIVGKTAKIKYK